MIKHTHIKEYRTYLFQLIILLVSQSNSATTTTSLIHGHMNPRAQQPKMWIVDLGHYTLGFLVAQLVKNAPAESKTPGWSLGWKIS